MYGSGWGLPFMTWSAVTRWWCEGILAVGSALEAYFVVADVTIAHTGLGEALSCNQKNTERYLQK